MPPPRLVALRATWKRWTIEPGTSTLTRSTVGSWASQAKIAGCFSMVLPVSAML
jgi:hypothetical protein